MLLISGLLTLLAIAHAGGDHIKGGSHHVKGGISPITQEAVAQGDIVPSPYAFNIKTGPAWGTKLTREETGDSDGRVKGSYSVSNPRGTSRVVQYHADDTGFHASVKTSEPNIKTHNPANVQIEAISKTGSAPASHHTVKTIPEEHGKLQSAPGLHHAASVPVFQDQVTVDEPKADDDSSRGIKTLQAALSGKTRFSSQDMQLKDPIVHSVTKSVKTIKDPSRDSSQAIKSVSTGQRQFTPQDVQGRDPITRNIKTVKTVKDSATQVASIKTESSIKSITIPNQSNIKSTVVNSNSAVKRLQRKPDYVRTSTVPDSIAKGIQYSVGTSLKDNDALMQLAALRPQEAGLNIGNENGEIVINEDMLKALQSIGGVINENGEIIINDETIQLIQKMGGNISGQRSTISLSPSSEQEKHQKIKPIRLYNEDKPRKPGSDSRISSSQAVRDSLSTRVDTSYLTNARKPTFGATQASAIGSQSAVNNRQTGQTFFSSQPNTVLFEGKEISIDGLKEGQLFDENLQPILSVNAGSIRQDAGVSAASQSVRPASRPRVTQNVAAISRTSSVQGRISQLDKTRKQGAILTDGRLTSPQATWGPVSGKGDIRYVASARKPISGTSQTIATGSQSAFANRQTGPSSVSTKFDTVLFEGKEISINGLKEGQLFDENLKPILSTGSIRPAAGVSTASQSVRPASRSRVTQNVATISRTSSVQGGISQLDKTRQQGPILADGRLTSTQATRGSVSGRGDIRYVTSARKPISGTSQTISTGSQNAFANRQTGPSAIFSKSDTVLFEGKEISIDGLKEGQLFDENLKPILSAGSIRQGAGVTTASQSVRPATRPRVTQNTAPISRTSSVQGGISQLDKTRQQGAILTDGRLTSLQATRGSVSGRGDIRYVTSARKPISGTSQTIPTGSRSAFANRQTGPVSSKSDTVLFEGKELNIDALKEGQLFDENLKPILSAGSIRQGAGVTTASQSVRPATRPRVTQNIATISRTSSVHGGIGPLDKTRQQGAILTDGRFTSPQATRGSVSRRGDIRYVTNARKPISGTSQTISTGSRSEFANRQTGPSTVTSKSDTVLFEGKEISIDGLKEGQLFDENLRPILSAGSIRPGARVSAASQSVRPASRPRVTQNVAAISRTSSVQGGISQLDKTRQTGVILTDGRLTSPQATWGSVSGRGDIRYVASARKPISGTSQTTATGSQSAFANRQTRPSAVSSKFDTVLFEGKEISIDGLKEGQLFDENLKPILSAGTIIPGAGVSAASQSVRPASVPRVTQNVATNSRTSSVQDGISQLDKTRQQGAILTDGRLTSLQATGGSVSGTGDIRYGTSARNPISGTSPTISTGSQSAFANKQIGISAVSSRSDTVWFEGKEISIDGLKEGQLFDENLKPILSAGSIRQGAGVTTASQSVRPATRPRVTPNIATISRTSSVHGGISPLDKTRQQGAILTDGRLTSPQATRGSVSGRGDIRYVTSARKPISGTSQTISTGSRSEFANRQTGPSTVSSKSDTVLFEGKGISIDGLKEGQLFDENLRPILSVNTDSVRQGSRIPIRSEVMKPLSRWRATQNVGSISRTGVDQTSRGIVLDGIPIMYNIPQRNNLQEITQDEIESKVIQQEIDPKYDGQQKVIQESFIDISESGFVKAPVTELTQKALDSSESKQTQLKVDDILEQSTFSVPDSSKRVQVQESVPIVIVDSTAVPKSISKAINTKVTQVRQEHIDDPAIQQQASDEDVLGYVPKASFLHGIPRIPMLNSGLKTSTIHEQQKLEQVFV